MLPVARLQQRGENNNGDDNDNDAAEMNDAMFDQWNGYSAPLFNRGDYDEEDKEADDAYQQVDKYLDSRRKKQREEKLK